MHVVGTGRPRFASDHVWERSLATRFAQTASSCHSAVSANLHATELETVTVMAQVPYFTSVQAHALAKARVKTLEQRKSTTS
mmetsp:Transcript_6976/g.20477  ORF Transcript_6976/g.20477 Transcript_6976/m.20477 type:complete len:82 (+) Transcript_6976:502-747(+)